MDSGKPYFERLERIEQLFNDARYETFGLTPEQTPDFDGPVPPIDSEMRAEQVRAYSDLRSETALNGVVPAKDVSEFVGGVLAINGRSLEDAERTASVIDKTSHTLDPQPLFGSSEDGYFISFVHDDLHAPRLLTSKIEKQSDIGRLSFHVQNPDPALDFHLLDTSSEWKTSDSESSNPIHHCYASRLLVTDNPAEAAIIFDRTRGSIAIGAAAVDAALAVVENKVSHVPPSEFRVARAIVADMTGNSVGRAIVPKLDVFAERYQRHLSDIASVDENVAAKTDIPLSATKHMYRIVSGWDIDFHKPFRESSIGYGVARLLARQTSTATPDSKKMRAFSAATALRNEGLNDVEEIIREGLLVLAEDVVCNPLLIDQNDARHVAETVVAMPEPKQEFAKSYYRYMKNNFKRSDMRSGSNYRLYKDLQHYTPAR